LINKDIILAEIITQNEIFGSNNGTGISDTENNNFSKISKYTKNIDDQTEKLIETNTLPTKEIISKVANTKLSVDLSFASVAQSTAIKLQKLEKFLGKIEDKLFSDKTLDNLSSADLLALYQSTRLMRTDAFKMLKDLRTDVDFDSLESQLLSLHQKMETSTSDEEKVSLNSFLSELFADKTFIQKSEDVIKNKLKT